MSKSGWFWAGLLFGVIAALVAGVRNGLGHRIEWRFLAAGVCLQVLVFWGLVAIGIAAIPIYTHQSSLAEDRRFQHEWCQDTLGANYKRLEEEWQVRMEMATRIPVNQYSSKVASERAVIVANVMRYCDITSNPPAFSDR